MTVLPGGVRARLSPRPPSSAPRPRPPRTPARNRARAAVFCFPVAFALCLAAAWTGADLARPEVADPEYLARRDLLRDRLVEQPDARLAVVVGSSRTSLGFVPETLPDLTAPDGRPVLWFNLSHYGAGPVFDLVILKRMVRDGFRPERVVIEVMPPFVGKESPRLVGMHLSARELVFAADYLPAGPTAWQFARHRFVKPMNIRQVFDPAGVVVPPGRLGGPPKLEDEIAPGERARRTAIQHGTYGPTVRTLHVGPGADGALRDALRLCRDNGIAPVLLLAPEGTDFRGWYDTARLKAFEAYLDDLVWEYGARLIDARGWLADDAFTDGHHPLRRGAVAFTARLVEEVRVAGGDEAAGRE